jgi:hypothetical protein
MANEGVIAIVCGGKRIFALGKCIDVGYYVHCG